MKEDGPLDRLRRVCGRIFPRFSSFFRAARPPPALVSAAQFEKETRGNHVVKTQWKPPVLPAESEPASPAVSLAALDLDIMLVDKMVRKLFGLLLHGGGGDRGEGETIIVSTQTPEGRTFIHQQLEELRAEKARYKEEKLALLERLEPREGSEHSVAILGAFAI